MSYSHHHPPVRRLAAVVLVAAIGSACSADSASDEDVSRIPIQPTAASAIPDAILGTAPAPQGAHVNYFTADSATRGYLAVPKGDGPFPALVLIHEWNGLVDRVRQVADALAAEGYVALAVDLYSGRTGSNQEENRALTRQVRSDEGTMIANLDAAVNFLRARSDVTGKVAAMGWCFGGGVALSFALGGENHEGTAIFYGSLVEDPEVLKSITHEVYGTFAALDQGIPPDQVTRFEAALRSLGIENDIHIYDDVNHGFWLRVDGNRELREAPALDAWQRLKAYLQRVVTD
jgi:carboxymethylenebutenolidase